MGPVQYVYLVIVIIFGLIGLARGYDKELGTSIILMVTIALLGFIDGRYSAQMAEFAASLVGAQNATTFLFLLYTILFVVVVFSSYSGITLNYGGTPMKGFGGSLLSLLVGLFNGYLIAGTLWHYANQFNYPLLGVTPTQPPPAALNYLPQTIFPDTFYWIVPAAILLILRVRG